MECLSCWFSNNVYMLSSMCIHMLLIFIIFILWVELNHCHVTSTNDGKINLEKLFSDYFYEYEHRVEVHENTCKLQLYCVVHNAWSLNVWNSFCTRSDRHENCTFIIRFKCFINLDSIYQCDTPPHGLLQALWS